MSFPEHDHPEGEEIFVLEGTFRDEHGSYPAGTHVLNPPGSSHKPHVGEDGCTIFVKLRQYAGQRQRLVSHESERTWAPHSSYDNLDFVDFYRDSDFNEVIMLVKIAPGTRLPTVYMPRGDAFFVLDGDFHDENGHYRKWSWISYSAGSQHNPWTDNGCTLYITKGGVGVPKS